VRWLAFVVLVGCGRYGFQMDAASADAAADADTSGLVAWYPMGSLANDATPDATGHGHDGICSTTGGTCPMIVAGRIGAALRFDGTNDHFTVAIAPDLDTTLGFTVAAWIWIDAPPSAYSCFVNKVIGTGGNDSWSACVTPGTQIFFGTNLTGTDAGDALLTPQSSVPINSWHHVAIRWDGALKSVSLDGIEKAGDQAATAFDDNPILIGYDLDNGAPVAPFAGILDEVRIYNRALTQAEITLLAQ
jgi:hypothetical protein